MDGHQCHRLMEIHSDQVNTWNDELWCTKKMYIVQDEEDIWFLNNGDYSPPSIVKDKNLSNKRCSGFYRENRVFWSR